MQQRRPEILILDDDPVTLETMKVMLSERYGVHCFSDVGAAEEFLRTRGVPLAILDLNLSGVSGIEVLGRWSRQFPQMEIVFCSGESRVDRAVECLRKGASDFISKPFTRAHVLLILERVLEKSRLRQKVEVLSPMVHPLPTRWVGSSPASQAVLKKVQRLKKHGNLNVLILGESGTGKELVAQLLHQQENQTGRPFVVVNMPAIPVTLVEAELFGVTKGAYTDAKQSRAGKFELADGGDIFLDEIGDLSPEVQAKILRTLQEKQVERVGATQSRNVEFRVVSATNQPLRELIQKGVFREDLLYRLSDVVLKLPPLRERKDDIPELIEFFVGKHAPGRSMKVSKSALETMKSYHWPGNVRQLESTIKRALAFVDGGTLDQVDLQDQVASPPQETSAIGNGSLEEELAKHETRVILEAIRRAGGDRTAAQRQLGISRATLYRKLPASP